MDRAGWMAMFVTPFQQTIEKLFAHLPALLGAILLLALGWLLATLLCNLTGRLIGRLDRLAASRAVQGGLNRIGVERSPSQAVGAVVFWVVFLLFATVATEALGLPVLTVWFRGLGHYLPRVLLGVLILFAGLLVGNVARELTAATMRAARMAQADLAGRLMQGVIVFVAGVTAADQVGIDTAFLTSGVVILFAGFVGGLALAFGLGARTIVSNSLAAHYVRQTYRRGQTVRVGQVQGTIVDMTPTGVILEGADGRILVPAKEFAETVSWLVS